MKFTTVAHTFDAIDKTASRLEITALLADLYKQASPEEAQIISYWAMGRLRPTYAGNKFNFAEQNLYPVIADLTGVSVDEVKSKKKKLGDLGLAVQQLDGWKTSKDLSVQQVYDDLVAFEQTSGTGSQEEKSTRILSLLQLLSPDEAKYVVKIILGTLRLGFSDMTIIDALSWMEVGDKSLRKPLEHAYNVCADLGLIAQTLKAEGLKGIKKMHIKLGIPIRLAAAERLPNAQAIFDKIGVSSAQPKLDGFRLQIHLDKTNPLFPDVKFYSRNLIDMTPMFPDLKAALEQLDCTTLICEGEAIVFDQNTGNFLPFQETVKRKRKHGIEEAMSDYPLQVYLFDLLFLNGKSYLPVPQHERYETMKQLVERSNVMPTVQAIDEKIAHSGKELEDYFLKNLDAGLEGIVVKKVDSQYEPGKRNFNWIKLKKMADGKLEDTIDCVVLGYYDGSGKRAQFGIGAFLVGVYNKEEDVYQSIAKIGTGLSDEEWKEFKKKCDALAIDHKPANVEVHKDLAPDVWVRPDIVCLVLADEITKSPTHKAGKTEDDLGYALRFPRFMGYRPDKSAQEATTAYEIKRLYEDQYGSKK